MKLLLIRALAILLVGVGLLFGLPAPVQSAVISVSMDLGGVGSTSWALNSLSPGSSGNQQVTLKNKSSYPGKVDIWLSNIRWTAGRDGNADLDKYLRLNINGGGVISSVVMPAKVSNLPGDSSVLNRLYIPRLEPGQTVNINWNWQFVETGLIQNDAQGDGLIFDINYALTQIISGVTPTVVPTTTTQVPTPTTPTPNIRIIGLEVPQSATQSGITDDGIVTGILEASTPDGGFMLSINPGTRVLLSDALRDETVDPALLGDRIPQKIEVTVVDDPDRIPPYPDGWVPVSPNYDINGVLNDISTGVVLDMPSLLVIKYQLDRVPQLVDGIYVFAYEKKWKEWRQLSEPDGFIAAADEKAGEVSHFSLFVVLAKPVNAGKPPANIIIQKINIDPPRIRIGQSSEVTVKLTNKGGQPGLYEVVIKMDGKVQKTQSVYLEAGKSTDVTLILSPGQHGIYTVSAGKLSGDLIVEPNIMPDVSETDYWWLLCIALGISTLILSFARRRHLTEEEKK